MYQLVDLTDRRVLVAGGSSGIGKAVAITLSRLGAKVVVAARREEQLRRTLAELEGDGHACYTADLSQTEETDCLVKRIVAEQGPLSGMVYAAGVTNHVPINLLKTEHIESLFRVNLYGYLALIRACTKKGRYEPGMRIVGISSVASVKGDKSHTCYSASKAAMDSAVRCIAKELGEKGICINDVAPAMTKTEMYDRFMADADENSPTQRELKERQYMGVILPEEVANAVAFLLSPAARPITGITMMIDGGLTTN